MPELSITAALSLIVAFGLSALFGHLILPVLRRKKAGQYINEYVSEAHQQKAGTPTMGGISFVPAFLLTVAIAVIVWAIAFPDRRLIPVALVVLYAIGNTAIGFVDDYFKLTKRQNEGLTDWQKFILQVVITAAFIAMMAITGNLSTSLAIPFFGVRWELGFFAYPIYLLVLVGFVNATNITDGLDGLSSSVCAVVAIFMLVFSFVRMEYEIGCMSAALLGCVLGFLIYNHHPAKMFMGDTGSLFLGAVIMGCAVMAGELLLFVLAGFMFVIEMLSSLIQRAYYKISGGKRIFKMAPLHHHFEKCGWKEGKIVTVFSLVSLLFCLLAGVSLLIEKL